MGEAKMTPNSESEAENSTEQATKISNNDSEHENSTATLRADYEQTNQQINMLADIRFKLLAFVPTLTAAAVALLTSDKVAPGTVLAVGILGFITVFAIAMYDLRNSQIYDACIFRARQLEKQLHMPSFSRNRSGGLYSERPRHTISLFEIEVWHDRALAYIYGAALGGWFYIIISSLPFLLSSIFQWSNFPLFKQYIGVVYLASILIAALVAYAFIQQFHQIEASRFRSRTLTVNSVDIPDPISKFVTVDVTLTNRRKHPLNYNALELKLRDNQEYPYQYSVAATEQQDLTGTLKSGEQIRLVLVYQIPEKNTPAKLVYTPHPRFLKVQQIIDLSEYTTKNIILVRHGDKDSSHPLDKDDEDKHWPLSQDGIDKINRLKDRLTRLNLYPEIYLTSEHTHAQETAWRLSDGRQNPMCLYAITPPTRDSRNKIDLEITQENIFEAIIGEAKQARVQLSEQTMVAIVGHVPRLDWILTRLTSSSFRSLNKAEAVWVRADSFSDFRRGKGVVQDWISGDKGSSGSSGGTVITDSGNSEQGE
jgi:phosphohistidine phosphatase SixA